MRFLSLAACLLAALGLSGCLSTHREEYHRSASLGVGPHGLESTGDGEYTVRDWKTPWLAQPDRARP
jgi:hypothetical protein